MASIKLLNTAINSIFAKKYNDAILKKFFTYEYLYLTGSPSLNEHKVPNNLKLSLAHVDNYFPFPLIFTRCIWKAFSQKQNKFTTDCLLSMNDYVNGFLTIYTGSLESRIRMVFHIFNVNKDKYAHIEDVKCILNYIHIYSNKKHISVLDEMINDFYGKHKKLDEENFISRTMKKHSGVFLIMMSIFKELKTFSHEILSLMGDSLTASTNITPSNTNPSKNNILMKRLQSKFRMKESFNLVINKESSMKDNNNNNNNLHNNSNANLNTSNSNIQDNNFFPKFHTNIGLSSKKKDDDTAIIDYIQANYNPDFTFTNSLRNVNQNVNQDNSDDCLFESSTSNANCIKGNSFVATSNDEMVLSNDFEYEYDLRDMIELDMFENDFKYLRFASVDNYDQFNYQIPKGSNDFVLKSGVVEILNTSNMSIRSKGSFCSLNKSYNCRTIIVNESNTTPNQQGGAVTRQGSPGKSSFMRSNSGKLMPLKKKTNENYSQNLLTSSPIRDRGEPNNSINLSLLSDHSSLLLNPPEVYEEEVSLMKNSKLKRYTLFLVKGFLVFVKKKSIDLVNLNDKDLMIPEIKRLIPLKHLFIVDSSSTVVISDKNYYVLNIGSTIQHEKRKYLLYFDTKPPLSSLTSLILTETNYISITKEYTYVKEIGRGSFCSMKLMRHNKSGKLFAVKQMKKNVSSIDEFNTQNWEKDIIFFLKNFSKCEHILKFYNVFESYNHLYVVSEFVEAGSLSKYLTKIRARLQPSSVNKIALHISKGLKELHKYGIIHRDLKLENIVMDVSDNGEFTAKLIDFGLSKVVTPLSRTNESYGTLIYCSPEIMLNLPYNSKVDVWSLGVIIFYLLFAVMPFGVKGNESEQEISHKIIVNNLKFPVIPNDITSGPELKAYKGLVDVITRSLYKDLEHRNHIDEVERKLNVCYAGT